jgi:hypothetical protein
MQEWAEEETRHVTLDIVPRREFCEERFHHKKGEHVVFGGPSTRGKTRLCFDLLEFIVTPDYPAYFAQSKPMDPETKRGAERLGFRTVKDWPAPRKLQEMIDHKQRPSGYVVCPSFGDINKDMAECARVTAALLGDRYTQGSRGKTGILVMDDTMVKAKIMRLDNEMITIIAMAGAMGISEWVFVQKPTDSGRITLWAYENATHCFFTKGGDDRMLGRYAEIAGEHGALVTATIPKLQPYQFLYLHKYEGWVCIVDKGE